MHVTGTSCAVRRSKRSRSACSSLWLRLLASPLHFADLHQLLPKEPRMTPTKSSFYDIECSSESSRVPTVRGSRLQRSVDTRARRQNRPLSRPSHGPVEFLDVEPDTERNPLQFEPERSPVRPEPVIHTERMNAPLILPPPRSSSGRGPARMYALPWGAVMLGLMLFVMALAAGRFHRSVENVAVRMITGH